MMKLGTQTGSMINHLYSATTGTPEPAVGNGATVLAWTDRYAATIIEVRPNGSFVCQEDHAERVDGNGMSEAQKYEYSPNPNGRTFTFARVRSGRAKGEIRENGRTGGYSVLVGRREKYYDFSF